MMLFFVRTYYFTLAAVLFGATSLLTAQQKPKPQADKTRYLDAQAVKGDDLPTLLQRYGLYDHDCNISKFFEINGLKEDYRLKAEASYKLPVLIYDYDGKSIRSTIGDEDWKKAVRIRDFNLNAHKTKLRKDDFIASRTLWVPWHELKCPEAAQLAEVLSAGEPVNKEKAAIGFKTFPIFGKNYEKTPIRSQQLQGRIFYLVSGHGGPDPGAQGKRAGRTLCEDEYAYDVTLRLARNLVGHSATVFMIVRDNNDGIRDEEYLLCDKDEVAWGGKDIPLNQKERLQQRVDIINELSDQYAKKGVKRQTMIEIHVDSRSKDARTDVFFYYPPGNESGHKLAQRMHQTFLQKYLKLRAHKSYNGTVSARGLFMLREIKTPQAVFIELGNIRNDWDQQRLVIKNNRQALANWLLEAILADK